MYDEDDETTVFGGDGSAGPPAPGWFGKLAMLGDFANRRLPPGFVQACDRWLSLGLTESRVQLGSAWLDTYLTGPIWRFAWAPGVLDGHWWCGVLMPSVDAVGRYFPLVIAAPRAGTPATADGWRLLGDWYAHVAGAALDTLQAGSTVDAFEAALARAPRVADVAPPAAHRAALSNRERCTLPGSPTLAQWASTLAAHESLLRYQGHSLWWPLQEAATRASVTAIPGLPAPSQFSLMLDGSW